MPSADARRPLRLDDLLEQWRVTQFTLSPDGQWAVFAAHRPDLERNRNQRHLFRVPLAGGEVEQLTRQGSHNADPAFSPDGRWLAFVSNREGSNQLWLLPWGGGEPRRLTDWPLAVRGPSWCPDGRSLLAAAETLPGVEGAEELRRREAERRERGSGRVVDELMFRHWDSWTEGRLEHLFRVDLDGGMQDLTPGPYPVPPRSLTGRPDYAPAPGGDELCFVSLREPEQARSTNTNLWLLPPGGGEPRRISPLPGCNAFPAYSPCGRYIAYLGMERAGYESDLRRILLYDRETGETHRLAPELQDSPGPLAWRPDGGALAFAVEQRGRSRIAVLELESGELRFVTDGATDRQPRWSPDGRTLVFIRETVKAPPELYRLEVETGELSALTALNREQLAGIEMNEPEDFWFEAADGRRVHGFLLHPPGFDPSRRYPVLLLVHGGPQGAWGLDFHERWNLQLFAAPGYVVVAINPRGSTGYGQDFVDAIHGEWGGLCYDDLMRGLDHVLATRPYCDPERVGAAGASFGGFMVNWMQVQTDRFRCLVSHDGIFNTEMSDFLTDELWFTEWEYDGAPWESPEAYRRWSPHRFIQRAKTPMLVVQGEQDFRCPVSEGLGLFTALRRLGVPARLLYFPDEGHWVVKPRNRRLWWSEVHGWLARYLRPGEA